MLLALRKHLARDVSTRAHLLAVLQFSVVVLAKPAVHIAFFSDTSQLQREDSRVAIFYSDRRALVREFHRNYREPNEV